MTTIIHGFLLERRSQAEMHTHEFLSSGTIIVAYLGFPLLEGIIQEACEEWISVDGKVLKPFLRNETECYGVSQPCSSLHNLLRLLRKEVASERLRRDLTEVQTLWERWPFGDPDLFKQLYAWRNGVLHGATSAGPIAGVLLSLSCLILMDGVEEWGEKLNDTAREAWLWWAYRGSLAPRAFYPAPQSFPR